MSFVFNFKMKTNGTIIPKGKNDFSLFLFLYILIYSCFVRWNIDMVLPPTPMTSIATKCIHSLYSN